MRVLQRNRIRYTRMHLYIHTCTGVGKGDRNIYYEELAHTVKKAACWRPRTAGDTIQSWPEGLRTRGANGVNTSLRSGEDQMR